MLTSQHDKDHEQFPEKKPENPSSFCKVSKYQLVNSECQKKQSCMLNNNVINYVNLQYTKLHRQAWGNGKSEVRLCKQTINSGKGDKKENRQKCNPELPISAMYLRLATHFEHASTTNYIA